MQILEPTFAFALSASPSAGPAETACSKQLHCHYAHVFSDCMLGEALSSMSSLQQPLHKVYACAAVHAENSLAYCIHVNLTLYAKHSRL